MLPDTDRAAWFAVDPGHGTGIAEPSVYLLRLEMRRGHSAE